MSRTEDSIHHKSRAGRVVVLTAQEITRFVRDVGAEGTAARVDVVTTGTFGAMCGPGVRLDVGHAGPPAKVTRLLLNGVEACAGEATASSCSALCGECGSRCPFGAIVFEEASWRAVARCNLKRHIVRLDETTAWVVVELEFLAVREAGIARRTQDMEACVACDSRFLTALEPHDVSPDAPAIVTRPAGAAARIGVGSVAAVSGAPAAWEVRAIGGHSTAHALVDSGDDIAMWVMQPVNVETFAEPLSIRVLALHLWAETGPVPVCTSSGAAGHSRSIGRADAAVAVAKSAAVAEAAPTAPGNAVRTKDACVIGGAMAPLRAGDVSGMLAIVGDLIFASGELPGIARGRVDCELMRRGERPCGR